MIVFVAGASREESRARKAMDIVRSSRHELAHDWIRLIEAHGSANHAVPSGHARSLSLLSFSHIRRSGILWLLFPQEETIGTWIEVGAFLMHTSTMVGARCIMSGGDARASIYLNGLVSQCFETDRDAAVWLENQAA